MAKKEFMYDFETGVLPDVVDREDCQNAWDALITAYIYDGVLTDDAWKWENPYLKYFES